MGDVVIIQRHAHMRVLKAAAVSIPFVRFFERPSRDARALEFLQSSLRTSILTAADPDVGLGPFMTAVAEDLARETTRLAPRMPPREAEALLQTIEVLQARARLDTAPEAYAGRTSGAALDAAVAHCIPEIGSIFSFAENLCGRLVGEVGLSLPEIRRSTSFAAAVGASCAIDDIGPTLASAVNLELPEFGFTEESLYSAPYLLAHELICHAAQGVLGPLPRTASGKGCAWSDGWMDCLAYDEAVSWLALQTNCPDWIAEGVGAIATSAEQAHGARYRTLGSSPAETADMGARRDAKAAWREFEVAARRAGHSEETAVALRRALSLRYNARNMNHQARQEFLVGLSVRLQLPAGSGKIIELIQKSLTSGNLEELQMALAT